MIRIAIVEDQDAAANVLRECLDRFGAESGESFRVSRFSDPVNFLDPYLGYDLVFMDIEMPHMDGMEAARQLREVDSQAKLIFVTNMARYAAKGYEVEALDFIVKPVAYSDFAFKMKRALSAIRMGKRREIMITQSSGLVRFSSDELLYVEVRGHKLTYHLLDREVEARGTMDSTAEALDSLDFLRCNSCYLINPRYIEWVRGHTVKVGNDELAISHPRRKQFLEDLSRWYTKGGG